TPYPFPGPGPYPGIAQPPRPMAPPALPSLLHVRFGGPPGMKAMFFRGGGTKGQIFDMPCVVGLRPGYRYHMLITDGNITGLPSALPVTLEVRGSLRLVNRQLAADFPVGIVFKDEDFAVLLRDGLVTKIAVLEPPDQAIPRASRPEDPLQINLPDNRDLI